mmetsp:Transcript_26799/g.50421  ORF Transcript_26799/g.50421 Transcript_26799/m.50421 type:complete len:270 (+) Transcript_26799:156-965(+)
MILACMLVSSETRRAFSLTILPTSSCMVAKSTLVSPSTSSPASCANSEFSAKRERYLIFNLSKASLSSLLSFRSCSPASSACLCKVSNCSAGTQSATSAPRFANSFSRRSSECPPLDSSWIIIFLVTCLCKNWYGSSGLSFIRLWMMNCMKEVRPCFSRYAFAASSFFLSTSSADAWPPLPPPVSFKETSIPVLPSPSTGDSKGMEYSAVLGVQATRAVPETSRISTLTDEHSSSLVGNFRGLSSCETWTWRRVLPTRIDRILDSGMPA